ncbi:polycystin-1-like protein 2 [Palaemon carinicauda]|uniref:polycystin-1-like protein 2 n=1 Tax=Palaemon carinicauda TaxID=392227 RepID=UPI0035B65CCF
MADIILNHTRFARSFGTSLLSPLDVTIDKHFGANFREGTNRTGNLLAHTESTLSVNGFQFTEFDMTYEMEVTIQKDTRTATAITEILIVEASVPEVIIRVPFGVTTQHFPFGVNRSDLIVDTTFFQDYSTLREFRVEVKVTDSKGAVGSSSYLFRLNQPPNQGNCSFQAPATARALLDSFTLECRDWVDPETVGIHGYKFILAKTDNLDKTLVEILHGTLASYSTQVVLPSGIFDIVAVISDIWGGLQRVTLVANLEVILPTQEELESVNITELLNTLTSSGQNSLLSMVLAAQSDVMGKASWQQLDAASTANLSQEAIDAMVISMADKNNQALDSMLETTNFNSFSSLESTSGSLATLMETVSSSPTASKTVDLGAREKIVSLVENLVGGLSTMDIPSPEMLQGIAQNILTAVAGITMGISDVNDDKENCTSASPADMRNADTMDYDTSLPDDKSEDGGRIEISVSEYLGEIGCWRRHGHILPKRNGDEISNVEPEKVNASGTSASQLYPVVYTRFNVSTNGQAVNVEITPECPENRLFIMLSKPRLPTLKEHENFLMVSDIPTKRNDTYDWFFPTTSINGTGNFFIGVGEFKSDFDIKLMEDPKGNDVKNDVMTNITCNYLMRIFTSGCYYFDTKTKAWISNGLEVTYADSQTTICSVTHLTSFGSGFMAAPNTIDFNYVFANMGFEDNLTIYITLIIGLSLFALIMIWARIKDKKDVLKLGASPLPDNRVEDKYLYEMLVFTGNKKEAQTDSVVQFILSGDKAETEVRTLGDSRRKILRKADVDVFVLAVPRPLGSLQFLRIWHDNSGIGPNASWFLSYIVFRDIQTGERYEFIANEWLAVESEDGRIDRLLQVAGTEERMEFKHLFEARSTKNISDAHLWFSVFLRPPRSRFTRCQRVGCCFALLFLSMLVNAMWYERVPEQPGSGGLNVGPFNLSPEQIGVGMMSNLIVFVPSMVIVMLFRKARPRKLRKSRVQEAVERTRETAQSKKPSVEGKDVENQGNGNVTSETKILTQKKKKKSFTLPWWFSIIAWILVWLCLAVSCFFLLMYGIQFGNTKATKWVTSLIISFFSSILFVQPLKIFAMAIFASLVCKSGEIDVDDADEDEEDPQLEHDERWLHSDSEGAKRKLQYKQTDSVLIRELRERRKKEKEMYVILKEIFSYFIFLWVLLTISYGNRDPNAFFLRRTLTQSFIHEGLEDGTDYNQVTNAEALWLYLRTGLLSDLRAEAYYNGQPPYGLKGFFNDHCNRIMGYATIKQIRAKKNTCSVPRIMKGLTDDCSGYSSVFMEDNEDYCKGWKFPTNKTKEDPSCQMDEFRYTSAVTLASMPVWGYRDWYGAGGYVIRLQGSTESLLKKFARLQKNKWINEGTRAVMVEFSSYNAQVNLFGIVRIMAEFTPGGGVAPSYRFDAIKLLQHHDNFGLFVIICEVAFILFVLYYTYREIRLVCKDKKAYFACYWSYAEIAIILASYSAIVIYAVRYVATSEVLKIFNETFGNGYISLQYAASLDEVYGYVIAFIVFVGTLKFIKILRFNKRMGVLSATLALCWDDLQGFSLAFIISFMSFSALFYMLLSAYLSDFSSFIGTIEKSFSMMLGKFDFVEMKAANSLTPIMFFVFVLCNSWVLINLLLTVIIRSFEEVKHDLKRQPDDYVLVPFILGRFKSMLGIEKSSHIAPLEAVISTQAKTADTVNELPDKVDKFVEFLNQMYFDGKLQAPKDGLKASQRERLRAGWYGNVQDKKF